MALFGFPFFCGNLSCLCFFQFDRTSVAKALVDAGALVNLEDNNANTPLHIASQFGAKNIVSFLLTVGADPEAVNADSLTPREIICDCLEFVQFPTSLQCPEKKCDSDEDIAFIRDMIDGSREVGKDFV